MPSSLFHIAIAGILASVFLAEKLDTKAVTIIVLAVIIPDLDTFIGLLIKGAHRTYLHNIFLPLLIFSILIYDTYIREQSLLVEKWGIYGKRVAWTGAFILTVAGIGMDLFFNGVNLFFPIIDQFYTFSGEIFFSNKRGLIQTIFEIDIIGTTETVHFKTGIDPSQGKEPKNVERIFIIAGSGIRFLLTVTGFCVVGFRLWENSSASLL